MPKLKSFKRSLLLGFVLATFLPLIILGYFSYTYLSYKIEESGQHNNEMLAAKVAAEISSYLYDPLVTLRQAAIMVRSHDLENKVINDHLSHIVTGSDFLETIYVIDHQKSVKSIGLADESRSLLEKYLGSNLSGLGILRNLEYLRAPHWTTSFLSPVSGKKSIALIYPDDSGNYFVGLFNIGYFHNIITNQSKKAGIETIVLDDNGDPVFNLDLKNIKEQQSFANTQPFLEAQVGVFGTYEFELNGIEYRGSTAYIPETKWLILVTQPFVIARKPIQNLSNFFLFSFFLSILIVIPLALRQSRRLLKPLDDLQKNIQAVADGDYQEKISKQSHEEFEQVAAHFRNMALAIEKREQLLEINEERLVSLLELHNTKQLGEDDLLEFALEQAVKLTRSEIGFLYLLESDDHSLNRVLWSSATEKFCQRYGTTVEHLADVGFWDESIRKRNHVIKNVRKNDNVSRRPNGVDITVLRLLCVPIFDDSKIVAVVGVFNKKADYDITDARQLSLYISNTWDILQQKRSQRDRAHLSEKLAQAQKLEAIGTLAGGIAHDFNNVLMVIIGNTELARDNIHSPDQISDDLDEIFKGALRARDLVNQILAFSRYGAGGLKPFDIRPIIKEAVKLLQSSIPANIEVRQNIAAESKPVLSEPGQINQLIMNLSTNAYQSMEGTAGILEISLQPVTLEQDLFSQGKLVVSSGEYMELVVSDTGKGIPKENIKRLFEPYFTTREKERGTGLGLAVVHGILKSLKGAITVESKLGKGSKFTIFLPAVVKESQSEKQILIGKLPRGNEHILYVDDDEAVAYVNSRMLENLGYKVTTLFSSTLALKEFIENSNDYDLVISDMAMPELSGDELAGQIMEHRKGIPVIICTGFSEKIDDIKAKELGVKELLMKPVTKIDLALTVRKVLGY